MRLLRTIIIALISLIFFTVAIEAAKAAATAKVQHQPSSIGRPALDSIQQASCDPSSPYYYPTLLKRFMANDTTMNSRDFQYFYYGTLFQEDYDPYRKPVLPGELESLAEIYTKSEPNRWERNRILDYTNKALADNPVDLQQLNNRIFVYEKNGKLDLAKIWQYKLNHLLKVIARSGSGADSANAWIVVYPRHEYDFLNLSGIVVTGHRFQAPSYDVIDGRPAAKKEQATQAYWFDIDAMLDQYYRKHPDEE